VTTGQRIREARRYLGVSQSVVADMLRSKGMPNASLATVSAWELGHRYPRRQNLFALARVMGVEVAWLERGDEE
jgi:transcriptional regulator with XRE-family HTH domain